MAAAATPALCRNVCAASPSEHDQGRTRHGRKRVAESRRAEDAARVSSYHPFPVRSDSSRDFTQRLCSGVPGLLFRLLPICIHNTPETLSTCRDRPADTSPNGGTLCNSGNHSCDARPHRRFQSGANHLNMDVPGLTDTAWLRGREGGDEMPGHASP